MAIELGVGIFIGYLFGVIKEKARWIEKYINSRQAQKLIESED